jgi:hypothetical protein
MSVIQIEKKCCCMDNLQCSFLAYSCGPWCWFLFQILVILWKPCINHDFICILEQGSHADIDN